MASALHHGRKLARPPTLDHVRHEIEAASAAETRDVATALRASGFRVVITAPETLTAPWRLTAIEQLALPVPPEAYRETIARVQMLCEQLGAKLIESVAEPASTLPGQATRSPATEPRRWF